MYAAAAYILQLHEQRIWWMRAGGPPFSLVFPLIMGALLWGGLFLREPRLRALLPLLANEKSSL